MPPTQSDSWVSTSSAGRVGFAVLPQQVAAAGSSAGSGGGGPPSLLPPSSALLPPPSTLLTPSPFHLPAEMGGYCTFCGKLVPLRWDDGSTNEPILPPCSAAGVSAAASGPPEAAAHAAEQAAAQQSTADELRRRLVEYDRNAVRRTAIYDDQADFFEIDSNAWLTDEVRPCVRM
jgi:hypothetical protein